MRELTRIVTVARPEIFSRSGSRPRPTIGVKTVGVPEELPGLLAFER